MLIKAKEGNPPTAYLSMSWLKTLPAAALDELAYGANDAVGGHRTGAGISRDFLETVRKPR